MVERQVVRQGTVEIGPAARTVPAGATAGAASEPCEICGLLSQMLSRANKQHRVETIIYHK